MAFYLNFLQHGRIQFADVEVAGEVTVGRDSDCKVSLPHESVSRHHATFSSDPGARPPAVLLRDEGSTNGTLVNGRVYKGEAVTVRPGDVIQIGVYRVELLEVHSSAASHPEDSGASRVTFEADPRSLEGLSDVKLGALLQFLLDMPRLRGPALLDAAARAMTKAVPADVAYIFVEAETGFPLTVTYRSGEPCRPELVTVDKTLVKNAVERGLAAVSESEAPGGSGPDSRALPTASISCPISAGGKICGAAYLRSPPGTPYTKEHLQFVAIAAGLLGLGIGSASLAEGLTKQTEKLEEILANLPEGIILLDADDKIVACNAAACRILEDEGLVGKSLPHVLAAADPALPPRALRARSPFEFRKAPAAQSEGRASEKVYGGAWATNPGKSGASWKHLLSLREVTGEKRRASVRLRLLGKLAQDVIQPFTVVTAVNSLVSQRIDRKSEPDLAEILALSEKHSEVCAELFRKFIDIAQSMGKAEPSAAWSKCPFEELVAASVRRFAQLFREKKFKIVQAFASGAASLEGDRNRLQEIFDQLVHNAVKHGKVGGTLILGADGERGWVKVSFLDDGPGIPLSPEGVRNKIVCELDSSHLEEVPAMGAGLWLVTEAVSYHDGKLRISSPANEDGTGTLVQVTLPGSAGTDEPEEKADTLKLPAFSYLAEELPDPPRPER